LRKKKPKRKSALTASRANKTKFSKQNHKYHKESVEQKLALRKDQCPSPPHQGAHHLEEQPGEAHLAGEERAAHRTDPQSREKSQIGACQGKPAGEARLVQTTGTPPPAEQGLPTGPTTTTTTTDRHQNIRHQTAHLQQEGEPTFIQPAPLAPKWSKKKKQQ